MKHNILGEVEQSDGHPFDAVTMIRHGSRVIKVGISRDDQPLETTLNLAAEVVSRLAELDKLAKRVAVADLREIYNSGWNEYDEAQEDGSFKTVSNPRLSEAEFEAKLSLNGVNTTGDQMIDFFYDDERMFWGHSVVVSSLNGTDFTNAHAEIFGERTKTWHNQRLNLTGAAILVLQLQRSCRPPPGSFLVTVCWNAPMPDNQNTCEPQKPRAAEATPLLVSVQAGRTVRQGDGMLLNSAHSGMMEAWEN